MEEDNTDCQVPNIFKNFCSENESSLLEVEDNYIQCDSETYTSDEFEDWIEDKEEYYDDKYKKDYTQYLVYGFIALLFIVFWKLK